MAAENGAAFVRARRQLMLAAAALWLCFGFVLPLLAAQIVGINFFGVFVGFAAIAGISLAAMIVTTFWFASRLNALEQVHDDR